MASKITPAQQEKARSPKVCVFRCRQYEKQTLTGVAAVVAGLGAALEQPHLQDLETLHLLAGELLGRGGGAATGGGGAGRARS